MLTSYYEQENLFLKPHLQLLQFHHQDYRQHNQNRMKILLRLYIYLSDTISYGQTDKNNCLELEDICTVWPLDVSVNLPVQDVLIS